MDRMDWNWDGDRKRDPGLTGGETSFTVDEILAEFWRDYSAPEEQTPETEYEDMSADAYEDTYEYEDSFSFDRTPEETDGPAREQGTEEEFEEPFRIWEPEKEAAEPIREQEPLTREEIQALFAEQKSEEETEEVVQETEIRKPEKSNREQESVESLFHNIRAYFRRNEDRANKAEREADAEASVEQTAEEREALAEGKKKKGVWEEFPDSPPEATTEDFVDDFDYSGLFMMFADKEEKDDGGLQTETNQGADLPEEYFDAEPEEAPADLFAEETTGAESAGEEKKENPRPLLAEDTMDFRDILREFMLGDQHPIYADIPGIGSKSGREENILPIPDFYRQERETKPEAEKPEEVPTPRRRRRYNVSEDFPSEPNEALTDLPTEQEKTGEPETPEEPEAREEAAEAEPRQKRGRKDKSENTADGELQENALLRMLRGFGGPTGNKKKALNAPSAYAGFEDYLPEPGTEEAPSETEAEPEQIEEQVPGTETMVFKPVGDTRTEEDEDEDELLYEGDFPPFWQWILNELMNLWIRINGIGDRASTYTMEDERENLGTEVNVANASRYYGSQVTMLRMRFQIGLALLAVMAYLTLGFPVSGMLKTAKVTAAMCLGLQLTVMLLCLDIVTNAAINLTRAKFGADALAVLCCVISSLDALTVAVGSFGTPHIPLCLFSSLALMGILFASLLSARGLRKSIRVPAIGKRAYCVTAEEGVRGKRDITLLKSVRPTTGFVRRSEEAPPDETLFSKIAVFELLAAIILALFTGVVKHSVKDMLFILSAILSCAVPLTALLAFALPFFIGSQRIFSSGAAVAGWSGIHDIGSSRNLIVTDRDLFPEETISIDTVRIFADESAERVIAYAGTMIAASGSGLGPCFAELMEKNGARMRQVEEFQWLSGGGIQGRIEGHRVLCGSSDLMQLMDVKIPYRLVDRTTVLLAIDGVLYGIFKINYIGLPEVRTALQDLIASNRHPIFAIRDFCITPDMLHEVFDVATDGYDFPPYGDRFRISEAQPSETSKIAAVVCREGLGPLTHLADTGRSMYIAVRLNLIITVLFAVLGMLLVFIKLIGTGMLSPWLPLVLMLLDLLAVTLISLFMRF